jgi:DNA-binding winged helix-turn-helix (wHTH) protein
MSSSGSAILHRKVARLLESPGELVTRDELQKRLWSSETYVDFEHGLNNAVNRIREVLGDSAESPRFIETLPKRGYRFIASVNVGASVVPAQQGGPAKGTHGEAD